MTLEMMYVYYGGFTMGAYVVKHEGYELEGYDRTLNIDQRYTVQRLKGPTFPER